jgi:hypothetical protein
MTKALSLFVDHLVKETATGAAFLIEFAILAGTGVDEQANGEWLAARLGEVLETLGPAIFRKDEIVAGQIGDNLAFLVTHSSEDVDHSLPSFAFGIGRARGGRDKTGPGTGIDARNGIGEGRV